MSSVTAFASLLLSLATTVCPAFLDYVHLMADDRYYCYFTPFRAVCLPIGANFFENLEM